MKSMLKTRFLILAFVASALGSGQAPQMALRNGDRVAFYGDSITAQRLYTRFMEDFVLTRYPNLQVTFFNAGVPGDTVNGGYTGDRATRLKRDLFSRDPSVVTIMLGMNDGYYVPFDPKYLKIFADGYSELTKAIGTQVPAARITLISPTPYDEVTHGTEFAHYNEVVSRNAAIVKDLAASSDFAFSDFNRTVTDLLVATHRSNPELSSLLVPDRIHPGEALHWVMAAELARTWGMSPIVSSVDIDASQARVSRIQRSRIEDLAMADGTLRWTQIDDALPLPLPLYDRMVQLVIDLSTLSQMDQELLRVNRLPGASYRLKIDNRVIGNFTRRQLAAGVNLALYATPMQDQAKDVDQIVLKRARLDEVNFYLFVEDPKAPHGSPGENCLSLKDVDLTAGQRKAAQPKPHRFELIPR